MKPVKRSAKAREKEEGICSCHLFLSSPEIVSLGPGTLLLPPVILLLRPVIPPVREGVENLFARGTISSKIGFGFVRMIEGGSIHRIYENSVNFLTLRVASETMTEPQAIVKLTAK